MTKIYVNAVENNGFASYGLIVTDGQNKAGLSGNIRSFDARRALLEGILIGMQKMPSNIYKIITFNQYLLNAWNNGDVDEAASHGWFSGNNMEFLNADLWKKINDIAQNNEVIIASPKVMYSSLKDADEKKLACKCLDYCYDIACKRIKDVAPIAEKPMVSGPIDTARAHSEKLPNGKFAKYMAIGPDGESVSGIEFDTINAGPNFDIDNMVPVIDNLDAPDPVAVAETVSVSEPMGMPRRRRNRKPVEVEHETVEMELPTIEPKPAEPPKMKVFVVAYFNPKDGFHKQTFTDEVAAVKMYLKISDLGYLTIAYGPGMQLYPACIKNNGQFNFVRDGVTFTGEIDLRTYRIVCTEDKFGTSTALN